MKHVMKKRGLDQAPEKTNPVAKHARRFNRSAVFENRKKAAKNGHTRFKADYTSFGDSRVSAKTSRKSWSRDDSKVVINKTVLLSSRSTAHRLTA